ncbi:hypothetical protein BZA05DRAFT_449358 [Tricharina praecox]|uniref:uncharacterized protein n=1 Tax=Tricharina praecox TaxID=43433 RepID=UPI00221E817F|nr:uncharacterized protein BZA05DRAFT_449358 [Tricharina praecox]KAI5841998.1 hypothetical protein BZA05DRAFT_449358 [Tricharina praecox]
MSSPLENTKLFTPLTLGNITLKHRVVMAPLTRDRSPEHIPDDFVDEYYAQRASDGGLLISEATHISVMGGNYHGVPGIFTPEQKRAWKKTTDAVHKKGGFIYCQLWHIGRVAHPANMGGRTPLSSSATEIEGNVVYFTPKGPLPGVKAAEMTFEDIKITIEDYVHAAQTAIDAGFDGVEVHSANGYLLDQFLCDNINQRTDKYGGSIENRSRFPLEVTDAVIAAIGADRVGIRFSPFGFYQETKSSDIHGQYGHVMAECDKRGLAYVHLVEPRSDLMNSDSVKQQQLRELAKAQGKTEEEMLTIKPFREILKNTPLITCGSFNAENSLQPLESNTADAIAYGRYFISNPDLPHRLAKGLEFTPYDRNTFYTTGREGYTDYPTYAEAKL